MIRSEHGDARGLTRGLGWKAVFARADLTAVALGLLLFACAPDPTEAPRPPSLQLPVEFVVPQRATVEIPGTNGALRVTLGDITDGQVQVTVASPTGPRNLAESSLREGDAAGFSLSGLPLQLELVELRNVLIGEDSAAFVLRSSDDTAGKTGGGTVDEAGRIEALLDSLESQTACTFIRNGKEYSAAAAAEHLRNKLASHRDEIHSVEDFIRICGSTSSMSGQPYRIRLADGQEVTSAEFLRELAGKLAPGSSHDAR